MIKVQIKSWNVIRRLLVEGFVFTEESKQYCGKVYKAKIYSDGNALINGKCWHKDWFSIVTENNG